MKKATATATATTAATKKAISFLPGSERVWKKRKPNRMNQYMGGCVDEEENYQVDNKGPQKRSLLKNGKTSKVFIYRWGRKLFFLF